MLKLLDNHFSTIRRHFLVPFAVPSNFFFPFSRNPANYKVVVGDHNRNTNEGTEEEVGAINIISHPQYNNPLLNNDIALIELSQPVKLSQRVNLVCLPSHDTDVPTGSTCYITGKANLIISTY